MEEARLSSTWPPTPASDPRERPPDNLSPTSQTRAAHSIAGWQSQLKLYSEKKITRIGFILKKTLTLAFRWGRGQKGQPQAVDSPQVWVEDRGKTSGLPCRCSPAQPHLQEPVSGGRLGGTAGAFHLDRTSEDSDTSFPSRVSIFFTTTALELVRLKEPGPPPEARLRL